MKIYELLQFKNGVKVKFFKDQTFAKHVADMINRQNFDEKIWAYRNDLMDFEDGKSEVKPKKPTKKSTKIATIRPVDLPIRNVDNLIEFMNAYLNDFEKFDDDEYLS